ncbi:MAG: thiosulfate sulfurtransferase/phosphatidylserine decarboxylase, partial [Pseudomonas sp.]|nr:thiosulfate sulfurtransferase/phosphatidylserine decarboxylase [Pseudomonas sp.]
RFKLGSTVIMLFGPDQVKWVEDLKAQSVVMMGQAVASPAGLVTPHSEETVIL